MSINRNGFIRNFQFNRRTSHTSYPVVIGKLGIIFVACAIVGCSQKDNTPTTAERVKLVEERQKTDPNSSPPKPTNVPSADKSNQVAEGSSPRVERTADVSKPDGTAEVRVR